jgi:hypothetical protein
MSIYKKVTFRHANIRDNKDQPMPVHIVFGMIGAYHWSDKTASTHIYTTAGILPVLEKPEQVDEILKTISRGEIDGE